MTDELRVAAGAAGPILPRATHVSLTPISDHHWLVTNWEHGVLLGWIRCDVVMAVEIARLGAL